MTLSQHVKERYDQFCESQLLHVISFGMYMQSIKILDQRD